MVEQAPHCVDFSFDDPLNEGLPVVLLIDLITVLTEP